MRYHPPRNYDPADTGNPNGDYWNGDAAAAVKGAIPPAKSVQSPQREIENVIVAAGLVPDAADETQLLQALKILIRAQVLKILDEVGAVDDGGDPVGDADPVIVEAGNVALLQTHKAAFNGSVAIGRPDPNRWIVLVKIATDEDTLAPTIDAGAMTKAAEAKSTPTAIENLGPKCAVFYKHVPDGESVTLNDVNGFDYLGGTTNVYRMVGVSPGSVPHATAINEPTYNSIAGAGPTPPIEVTHPGAGCVFVAFASALLNGSTPLRGINGCDDYLTYPGPDKALSVGIAGANRALPASNSYSPKESTYPLLVACAVTFEYDATPTEFL